MPVTRMQKHFTFARAHEVVLLIWNIDAVAVDPLQAILICKRVQPENIRRLDRLDGAGMKVRVELDRLHNTRGVQL